MCRGRKDEINIISEIQASSLTGLLPVPTGSFSSAVGEGKLWKAHISSRQSNHLSACSAIHAPWDSIEQKK